MYCCYINTLFAKNEVNQLSEIKNKRTITRKMILPLLPLRGLTVFPYMTLHFDVGREKSIKAVEEAMNSEQLIFLTSQKDIKIDEPKPEDVYEFGTVSRIKQIMKLQNGNVRILVEGLARGKISKIIDEHTHYIAELKRYPLFNDENDDELEAFVRTVKGMIDDYLKFLPKMPDEIIATIMNITNPEEFIDVVAGNLLIKIEDKNIVLSETNIRKRVEKLIDILNNEVQIIKMEYDIAARVKEEMDKHQKEYYLREQIKAINEELGDKDGVQGDCAEYQEKIRALNIDIEIKEKLLKDVERLSKMTTMSSDSTVMRNYLDVILEMPWGIYTKDRISVKQARNILDAEHYGLKDVKERIEEFLAVKQLSKEYKGTILCLVGPPGVGKTSIAKSIAKSMNRNYVRISLGGIRDEAEIRGHRKTYVGAMPGRIVNAIKQAKSMNAFVLLDEIDKLSSDYKGDPSSALLEVLDAEQNFSFRDNFLEIPMDLSDVIFVTTANSLDTISRPLLDRMEVINISSYTLPEKVEIAFNHLVPKQRVKHGLDAKKFRITRDAIRDIVNYYTRESGVRNLERSIAEICRKIAKSFVDGEIKSITVTPINLEKYLGKRKYLISDVEQQNIVGVSNGLAWTSVGGDTLEIETNVVPGSGKIELTGKLGEVMKESAVAAISYIRANCSALGIDEEFYKKTDIHVHVPEGAVPKDGPSAGITIATSVVSALTKRCVRHDVAMTGEITIRGRVLPIGGLKEKSIAAHRAGIKTVIIPKQNETDINDIPESVRNELNFVCVDNIDKVFEIALCECNAKHEYNFVDIDKTKNKEAVIKQ